MRCALITYYLWLREQAATYGLSQSAIVERVIEHARQTPTARGLRSRILPPRDAIAVVCQQYGIASLKFFGSVLRPDFSASSDIDLLVTFHKRARPTLFTMVEIEQVLSKIFRGRKIDLRTAAELSPYFRERVLAEAESIYESADTKR